KVFWERSVRRNSRMAIHLDACLQRRVAAWLCGASNAPGRGDVKPMNAERLLARFLRYVQIDTMARDDAGKYPSSAGQLELGRMIADELGAMGASEVVKDEHGIVRARLL